MAEITDLIDLAGQKDYAKADNVFNELMQDRMNVALDQEKIKLAANIYNGIEPEDLEQDEVDPETQLVVDGDSDVQEIEDEGDEPEEEPEEAA